MKFIIAIVFAFVFFQQCVSAQPNGAAKALPARAFSTANLIADLKFLSSDALSGRGIGTPGGETARQYLEKRFRESGIKAFDGGYLKTFEFSGRGDVKIAGANVVGFVEGTSKKDSFIVVSAHYDHVGIEKNEIYNGADDNASGAAALMAIAEYLKANPPAHSIIFAAFDGEESGLRGAKAFVEKPPVQLEKIVLNINMDMISRSDKNEIYAAGAHHYPRLKAMIDKIAKTSSVKLLQGHDRPELGINDWTKQSDHYAFHAKKIPFVYFGVEDHADYHRPTDDFEKIDQEFYIRVVDMIASAVTALDREFAASITK